MHALYLSPEKKKYYEKDTYCCKCTEGALNWAINGSFLSITKVRLLHIGCV